MIRLACCRTLFSLVLITAGGTPVGLASSADFDAFAWNEINPAAGWDPRAGLEIVQLNDALYVMGGRTPINPAIEPVFGASTLWADVWRSTDVGQTWNEILATETPGHWSGRAYFEAVTKGDSMYVIGGQDFSVIDNPAPFGPRRVPFSNFFSDVWSSTDGVHWVQKTADAGWEGRAGLSSIVLGNDIFVFGGSKNDDAAVVGPGGPAREYFNDVWKSSDDGTTWQEVTSAAPWQPRAGAAVAVKDDYIYLLGGEDGFTCDSGGTNCPPYFNDVWRTQDGANWELVTAEAAWPARPGHVAVVVGDDFVVFGGFGLSEDPTDPFAAANPVDMWVSADGANWELLGDTPWNATSPEQIKYDFDAIVLTDGASGSAAILTVGGDRETFNPLDPLNYLNVDNDVWRYALVPEPSAWGLFLVVALVLGWRGFDPVADARG